MIHVEPRIIAFLCQWCAGEGADAAGRVRLDVPTNLRGVRVPCSGRISPGLVLEALSRGADGVLILGCRLGECHYRDGNSRAMAQVALLRRVMAPLGIEPERLGLEWVAAGEGQRFAQVVLDMVEQLRRLGPLGRFAERGRISWRPREEVPLHIPSAEGTGVFPKETDS